MNQQQYYNIKTSGRNHAHSLQADMLTGWRPKINIIGPMPLNFDNQPIDSLIKPILHSDTSIYQVLYLGARPINSINMHQMFAKQYHYKYQHLLFADTNYMKPFFNKFYSQFQPQCKRPFHGMNPNTKTNIKFESRFQSGNLDCVISNKNNEYDMILRIDSNTAGHIMWYYFNVTNLLETSRTVKINIVNLRKTKSFYNDSFRPYIKRESQQWVQGGQNILITEESIQFGKQSRIFSAFVGDSSSIGSQTFRKLSFELKLEPKQEVYIAYSIPYTYSQLLRDIRSFKKLSYDNNIYLEIQKKSQSLSGLEIPYIKIMENQDDENKKKKKYCIFIIGRQHPGQSNGSHVLKGFINTLLSQNSVQMNQMRKHCVFHIIPMLNPDGTVIGNFRTSLYGKDLNRLFKKNQTMMIPEVQFARNIMFDLSRKYGQKLFMFLDFHGHSVRRNAFCFAPSFLDTQGSEDIRQFPRTISCVTQIFRYQSCSFRISTQKKTTARAVFSKLAGLCYTIQASNWGYFSKKLNVVKQFKQQSWNQLGHYISIALGQYLSEIIDRKMKLKARKQDKKKGEQLKFKRLYLKTKQDESPKRKQGKQLRKIRNQSKQIILPPKKYSTSTSQREIISNADRQTSMRYQNIRTIDYSQLLYNNSSRISSQKIEDELTKTIKDEINDNKQEQYEPIQQNQQNQEEEGDDSDGSNQQNMRDQKFNNYINKVSKMFVQFEKAYYGDGYNQKKQFKLPTKAPSRKKRQSHSVQQACLRYKINEIKNQFIDRNQQKLKQQPSHIKIRYSHNNRSVIKLDSRKKIESQSKVCPLMALYDFEQDPKKQILSSLPRISVINYLPLEDGKVQEKPRNKSKSIFHIPKIQTIKSIKQYQKNI